MLINRFLLGWNLDSNFIRVEITALSKKIVRFVVIAHGWLQVISLHFQGITIPTIANLGISHFLAGDAAARAVLELLPQAKPLKCTAVDWNQHLLDYWRQLKQQLWHEEDLSL
ncbi:MAG: hypothetical protein RMY28_013665 [Nostoc sp. ChiSLP01]|nr:hypothetical protein [Nostoc sp. CmiSLP01]MDZ8284596.1 hypothetical protein [Nostoc sp. ChiSLP01]